MKDYRKQKQEIRALRRENARLRRCLEEYRTHDSARFAAKDLPAHDRMAAQATRRYRLFSVSSYPRHLWQSLRENSYYQRIRDFWIHFRRYRLISRCITVAAALFAVMGTGAVILISTMVCLLLIPAVLLLAGGTTLLGLFRRRHQNECLRPELDGRTVYLVFPTTLRDAAYQTGMLRELAQRPDSVVFVISPHIWSGQGLGGHGFYINARREEEHLFLLRPHYYFFFRRLLDPLGSQRTVAIF